MTPADFRKLALEFPETVEAAHMNHPDFRVRGKIFATLTQDETRGMVKLTPEQQAMFVRAAPKVYEPVNGAWGRQGCTYVRLRLARKTAVREAMTLAWSNTAPKRLVQEYEENQ